MNAIEIQVKPRIEPIPIGFRKDGRPIYPISGGESDDDLPYKPNALRRIGYSAEDVEKAIKDRETQITNLRFNEASRGRDPSVAAVVARYGLQDPTDAEIAADQTQNK